MSGVEEARESYSDIGGHERCHITVNETHGLCGSFEFYHDFNIHSQYVKEAECSCGRTLCRSCINLVPQYFKVKDGEWRDFMEKKKEKNGEEEKK